MIHKLLAGKGKMKRGLSLLLCLALLGSSVISSNVTAEAESDVTVDAVDTAEDETDDTATEAAGGASTQEADSGNLSEDTNTDSEDAPGDGTLVISLSDDANTDEQSSDTDGVSEADSNSGISLTAGNNNYGSSPYSGHIDVRLVTGEYTFTQTVDTSTVESIRISKVWSDASDVDHSNDSVSVYLRDSEGEEASDKITLNDDNGWTSTLSDLDLEEGTYYVTEDEVQGYTSTVTDNGKVEVTSSSSSSETYTVKVSSLTITDIDSTLTYTHSGTTKTVTGYTKGSDTESGLSVAEYSFNLGNNAQLVNGDKITITVSFKVSYTITDSTGTVIKTVTDETHPNVKYVETVAAHGDNWVGNYCHANGYDFYVLPSELLENIINQDLTEVTVTNTPSTIDIPVEKTWDDDGNSAGIRPTSVTVTLYAGGTSTGQTLTLSEDNDWSGTFEDLPEYDVSGGATNATKIEYTVKETSVTGYTSSQEIAANGTVTITNTLETVDIPVTKVWNDYENYYSTRPDEVTVALCKDGEATEATLELSATNDWKGTFENLPAYELKDEEVTKVSYSVGEVTVNNNYTSNVTANGDESYTVTNTLKTATVTVTKKVDGNMADTTKKFTFTVSYVDGSGNTVTNKYELAHGGNSEAITVPYGATVTVTEDSDGYAITGATLNGENVLSSVEEGSLSFTVSQDSNSVVITNYKNINPDTGINLDSAPYILMLAGVAILGGVVLFRRRRKLL